MTEEINKEESKKIRVKKKVVKPVPPKIYEDGEIQMPFSMITDRESFLKLWTGKLKNTDVNKAWERAEKFKSKYD